MRTVLSSEPERASRSVGAPGHAEDRVGVSFEDAKACSGIDVPDARGVVDEPERASERRHSRPRCRRIGVTFEDADACSGFDVPDAHGVVVGARKSESTVGAPGHALDVAECPSRTRMQVPESTSQMRTVLSSEPERASRPSALQATLLDGVGVPSRTRMHFRIRRPRFAGVVVGAERASAVGAPGHAVDRSECPSRTRRHFPESTSQMRTVLSVWSQKERVEPSALQATLQTRPECPSRTRMQLPDLTSQIRAVLSTSQKERVDRRCSRPRCGRSRSVLRGRGCMFRTRRPRCDGFVCEPERASRPSALQATLRREPE